MLKLRDRDLVAEILDRPNPVECEIAAIGGVRTEPDYPPQRFLLLESGPAEALFESRELSPIERKDRLAKEIQQARRGCALEHGR